MFSAFQQFLLTGAQVDGMLCLFLQLFYPLICLVSCHVHLKSAEIICLMHSFTELTTECMALYVLLELLKSRRWQRSKQVKLLDVACCLSFIIVQKSELLPRYIFQSLRKVKWIFTLGCCCLIAHVILYCLMVFKISWCHIIRRLVVVLKQTHCFVLRAFSFSRTVDC